MVPPFRQIALCYGVYFVVGKGFSLAFLFMAYTIFFLFESDRTQSLCPCFVRNNNNLEFKSFTVYEYAFVEKFYSNKCFI